jgi:hypothetical protein
VCLIRGGSREYLVKWQGYTVKDSTWETEKNLMENCEEEVQAFLKAEDEKTGKKGGEGRAKPKKRG